MPKCLPLESNFLHEEKGNRMQDLKWFEAGYVSSIFFQFQISTAVICLCLLSGLAMLAIKTVEFTSKTLARYSLFHHAHLGNIEREELNDTARQTIESHCHYKRFICLLAVIIELGLFIQVPYEVEPKVILNYVMNTVIAIDTVGSIVQGMPTPDIDWEELYIT